MIDSVLSSGEARALGWSLLGTLWQAGLVWAALRLVLRAIPPSRCRLRYRLALMAGGFVLFLWLGTGLWLTADWRVHANCWDGDAEWVTDHAAVCRSHGRSSVASSTSATRDRVTMVAAVQRRALDLTGRVGEELPAFVPRTARGATPLLGILTLVWIGGVMLMSLRIGLDLSLLGRIRTRSNATPDPALASTFLAMRDTLRVSAAVSLRVSPRITSPGTAGWRRPVVLMPAGLRSALDPRDLQYLLAHELAHVRARDYPVGLVQLLAERALFFNPFVTRISRTLTEEREAARDQTAVAAVGSPEAYGKMLLKLEDWRKSTPSPVGLMPLAPEGGLTARVERLVGKPRRGGLIQRVLLPVVAVPVLVLVLAQATLLGGGIGAWAVMSLDLEAARDGPTPERVSISSASASNPPD